MTPVPIISVTGTKGKTTTVAVIADVLQKLEKNVLKVDTTGHFVNGERRSTLDDSKNVWRLVPSVCPGRYLWEFHANPSLTENGVAVLECSLGSSATSGLGYRYHNVGVFLNVFEDHLGSSDRIQTRADIAKAKRFIFSRIAHEGAYAVFNADDDLVVGELTAIPKEASDITLIPMGLEFSAYKLQPHLDAGGTAITINDKKQIIIKTKDNETVVADLNAIPWTFNGSFGPSSWNLLAAVGALYGYYQGVLPDNFREVLESVRLDRFGGRLTLLESPNGVKVLADYAHEKISMGLVAKLARTQLGPEGRVIGIVRLAHDRTDDLMIDTGKAIASEYDELVVYDKIDGYLRKATNKGTRFPQIEGRTSQVFADAIREINPHVTRIVREDEAIAYAATIAKPGDVVVAIVNDDIEQSIGFIQDSFRAEFV
jgi:cyanophycin synthetase